MNISELNIKGKVLAEGSGKAILPESLHDWG
jgi:hypothetical protein